MILAPTRSGATKISRTLPHSVTRRDRTWRGQKFKKSEKLKGNDTVHPELRCLLHLAQMPVKETVEVYDRSASRANDLLDIDSHIIVRLKQIECFGLTDYISRKSRFLGCENLTRCVSE